MVGFSRLQPAIPVFAHFLLRLTAPMRHIGSGDQDTHVERTHLAKSSHPARGARVSVRPRSVMAECLLFDHD